MKYTKEDALQALEDMDDYSRMGVPGGVECIGAYGVLKAFIGGVCTPSAWKLVRTDGETEIVGDEVSMQCGVALGWVVVETYGTICGKEQGDK